MPSLSDRLELTILSKYRQATNIYGSEIRLSDLAAGQELGLSLVNAYTCRRLEDAYGTAKQDFMQYCDRQLYEKQKFSGLLLFDSTIVKIRNVRDEAYLAYKRSQAKANERKISFEAVFQRLCNIYHPTQSQIEVLAEDLKVRCTAYIQQCWREYLQESTEVTAVSAIH